MTIAQLGVGNPPGEGLMVAPQGGAGQGRNGLENNAGAGNCSNSLVLQGWGDRKREWARILDAMSRPGGWIHNLTHGSTGTAALALST